MTQNFCWEAGLASAQIIPDPVEARRELLVLVDDVLARLEVTSPGGLVGGVTAADVGSQTSMPQRRNSTAAFPCHASCMRTYGAIEATDRCRVWRAIERSG